MTTPPLIEVNFDGLVGPTHNYAGLSHGNVASTSNASATSRPRDAALQGLAKMRKLMELGLVQGILPPQERPDVAALRSIGFSSSDAQVIMAAHREDPVLLAQVCSASCMWTANAATIAPSCDTRDGKVHLTPANLKSMFHRSIEASATERALRVIFGDESVFRVHPPLPASDAMSDEGAANHTRLFDDRRADEPGDGVHLFVYGVHAADRAAPRPKNFPARQTREASRAVARLHGLDDSRCVFAQQHPAVIDQGVFHNDVICVGSGRVLFYHEHAFVDEKSVLAQLRERLGEAFTPVRVRDDDVPVATCVATYLFNSQLVQLPGGDYALIAPGESMGDDRVRGLIDRVIEDSSNPIRHVHYMNLRESMRNGGGPACLRLRVPLTREQIARVHRGFICTEDLLSRLELCVATHWPEELTPDDLHSPRLIEQSRQALDAMCNVLGFEGFYPFQRR
jgi:succinylarginine dihydrolase